MKLRIALVAIAATALMVPLAGAASAQSTTVWDGADTTGSPWDIRTVKLEHQTKRVVVRTRVTDLAPDGAGGLAIYIDTNSRRQGPEFRLTTGLDDGTGYWMFRVRNWRPVGQPLNCYHKVSMDRAANVVRFTVASRACLGSPRRVRIGMQMTDKTDASHPLRDHLIGYRKWTSWMSRG